VGSTPPASDKACRAGWARLALTAAWNTYALVIHQRQRLPLLLEALDDRFTVHAELDQLERDAALHRLPLLAR